MLLCNWNCWLNRLCCYFSILLWLSNCLLNCWLLYCWLSILSISLLLILNWLLNYFSLLILLCNNWLLYCLLILLCYNWLCNNWLWDYFSLLILDSWLLDNLSLLCNNWLLILLLNKCLSLISNRLIYYIKYILIKQHFIFQLCNIQFFQQLFQLEHIQFVFLR